MVFLRQKQYKLMVYYIVSAVEALQLLKKIYHEMIPKHVWYNTWISANQENVEQILE